MAVTKKKLKSYVGKFTIRLGPIQTTGKLVSLYTSKSKNDQTSFKMYSPDGDKVWQAYTDGSASYKQSELKYGTVNENGEFVLLTKDQLDVIKASKLPKNVMNLTVHDADEIGETLAPVKSGGAYVFYPDEDDPANVQWAALLTRLLNDRNKALVGYVNLQNYEGLFRLVVWRGRIVVQKQAYPEDINPHEEYELPEVDDGAVEKASVLLDKLTAPFDAANYTDNIKAKVKDVTDAMIEDGEAVVQESPVTDSFDILSALDNFEV